MLTQVSVHRIELFTLVIHRVSLFFSEIEREKERDDIADARAILFRRFNGKTQQPRNSPKRFKQVGYTCRVRLRDGTGSLSWYFIENHERSRASS